MSETLYLLRNWKFFRDNAFDVIFETRALFVKVTVKIDWSIYVRWLNLAHVLGVISALGGAVISC